MRQSAGIGRQTPASELKGSTCARDNRADIAFCACAVVLLTGSQPSRRARS